MEGNMSQGGMLPGGSSFGGLDLQGGSMRVHGQAQQNPHVLHHHHHHQPNQLRFPLSMGTMQSCDQTVSMSDYGKGERGKNSISDDEDPSLTEEVGEGHNDASKGKKGSPWQRVKWTDKMVRLLITAVSYIGEDASDCGGGMRRKFAVLQKKGKWKSVSKVMAERGFHVSPQQCEDKFNDLNKRYKKLNDMLGRGTSCQVVENPQLLDVIDYLNEKEKDEVRKILSSKHLFYEEMCSYHNGNRLHLPHDPALQRSLHLALKNRDDHDNYDEDEQDMEMDDHDEFEEPHISQMDIRGSKKVRQGHGHEDLYPGISQPQVPQSEMNQALPENMRAAWLQKQWIESRSLQLEEQKVQIQVEMLELEKQRFKWQRFSKKRDRELEKMRMENERMKLENERIALELRQKEMGADYN